MGCMKNSTGKSTGKKKAFRLGPLSDDEVPSTVSRIRKSLQSRRRDKTLSDPAESRGEWKACSMPSWETVECLFLLPLRIERPDVLPLPALHLSENRLISEGDTLLKCGLESSKEKAPQRASGLTRSAPSQKPRCRYEILPQRHEPQ